MEHIVTIILARGGSKGIPKKNIIDFCGKPLLSWTIDQFSAVKQNSSVWVSSDCEEILNVAKEYGAKTILRPNAQSSDIATSESAWLHAINEIEKKVGKVDVVLAPQVTSPLRETVDVERGVKKFIEGQYDSMFSSSVAEDLFFWEKDLDGNLNSLNYDFKNRQRRQDIPQQYIENGSFYIFTPNVLRENNNRFGGKIGFTEMEFWKMFEIDNVEDLRMCTALMNEFLG